MEDLAAAWREARQVVLLTGAGLSTASGIPDFRSPGGLWERFQTVTIDEFLSSEAAREGYWQYKSATWEALQQAQPNPGHKAITDLARAGHVALLATQNIDGLHERSGFPEERIIRVHGTDSEVMCMSCDTRRPRRDAQSWWLAHNSPPRCSCGGWWKPATISFGMSLVPQDLQRAMASAASADLLLAVGTSLEVGPVNSMVPTAAAAGASIAILTASETPFDHLATWRCTEPLQELLPLLRDKVMGPEAS